VLGVGRRVDLPYDVAVPPADPSSTPISPPRGEDWTGLLERRLPTAEVSTWLVRPDCGATVVFTGTSRNHSEGRDDVQLLTYEAYDRVAVVRIGEIVAECRRRWPEVARVAILHRVGEVPLGEEAVVVGVSSAHRDVAFDAGRWCIDAVKASVPVWKQEVWAGGADWGLDGADLVDPSEVPSSSFGAGGG
jgi:molybdopterin synthase catalytic subunit